MSGDCKHLRFRIYGDEPMGDCTCLDCGKRVSLADVFEGAGARGNELLEKLERLVAELERRKEMIDDAKRQPDCRTCKSYRRGKCTEQTVCVGGDKYAAGKPVQAWLPRQPKAPEWVGHPGAVWKATIQKKL